MTTPSPGTRNAGGRGSYPGNDLRAPFDLVPVSGWRRLHVLRAGQKGAPCVVFDHGAFGFYGDGWWLKEALQADFDVVLYDRAGMGFSDPVEKSVRLSADWHVSDLRRLLAELAIRSPVILVGHSMAGLRLHAYANLFSSEVAGLVFVDAMSPRTRVGGSEAWILKGLQLALRGGETAARFRIASLATHILTDDLELRPVQAREKHRLFDHPPHWSHSRREFHDFRSDDACFSGEGATRKPCAVFARTSDGGANAPVAIAARRLSGFGEVHSLESETHTSLLNPANAAVIAGAVRRISSSLLP